jgi:hypothetical protein
VDDLVLKTFEAFGTESEPVAEAEHASLEHSTTTASALPTFWVALPLRATLGGALPAGGALPDGGALPPPPPPGPPLDGHVAAEPFVFAAFAVGEAIARLPENL